MIHILNVRYIYEKNPWERLGLYALIDLVSGLCLGGTVILSFCLQSVANS